MVRTYTALGVPKYQYFKSLDLYDTAGYKALKSLVANDVMELNKECQKQHIQS